MKKLSRHRNSARLGLLILFASKLPISMVAEEKDKDGYPIFDPSNYSAGEVVENLYSEVNNRLRLGFYEEALVAGLRTAEQFDSNLGSLDQALLDELVGDCLKLNRTQLDKARSLFTRANEIRTSKNLHEEGDEVDWNYMTEGYPSRLRLFLKAAECSLEDGDRSEAANLYRKTLEQSNSLFGGSFQSRFGAMKQAIGNQIVPGSPLDEQADAIGYEFPYDVYLWSRIVLGMARSQDDREILHDPNVVSRIESLLDTGFIAVEVYRATYLGEGTVGRPPLNHFLDLVVEFVESRRDRTLSSRLAEKVVAQLADKESVFLEQPSRLLRIAISARGSVTATERDRIFELLQEAERWGETPVYRVALTAFLNGKDARAAGEAVLFGKNIATSAMVRTLEEVQNANHQDYPKYLNAFDRWVDSRLRLGLAHPATITEWDRIVETLAEMNQMGAKKAMPSYPQLDADSVAIEFAHVPNYTFQSDGGWAEQGKRYVALIFQADGSVSTLDLGDASPIDKAILDFRFPMLIENAGKLSGPERDEMSREAIDKLTRLLLDPIRNGSQPARQAKTWIVSFDGSLEMLPLFPLNWEGDILGNSKVLIHVNEVGGWTSDLVSRPQKGRALLVGNPTYDMSNPGSGQAKPRSRNFNIGGSFPVLHGTAVEISDLEKMLTNRGISCTVQSENEATERNFRNQLASHSLLHVATHGYYLKPENERVETSDLSESDGLFRSAVVFSGANTTIRRFEEGLYFPANDDGMFLAAEFLPMDLRHVNLISLSACETALGDVTEGEGVAGLSQGLSVAGVQNMLLTLWPISDEVTPQLILDFYDDYLAGKDPHLAMIEAQREIYSDYLRSDGLNDAIALAAPFRLVTNTMRRSARSTNNPPPSAPVSTQHQSPPTSTTTITPTEPFWVIACQAEKSREAAQQHATHWSQRGLPAGILWIPNYASLSGAEYWLTFVGPWPYGDQGKATGIETLKEKVLPHFSSAYGIRVDQTPQRETFTSTSKVGTSTPQPPAKPKSFWVIACQAEKSEVAAEQHANRWKQNGLPAGILWIPDYASLSGAEYWLTYVGPWDYADGTSAPRQTLHQRVKPLYPSAYGIRVDQTPKRETLP